MLGFGFLTLSQSVYKLILYLIQSQSNINVTNIYN